MADTNERLTPETIDEELEVLAQRLRYSPPKAPRTPGMQVVQALEEAYAEEQRADAASLERVWERLAYQPQTWQQQEQPSLPVLRLQAYHEGSFPMRRFINRWRERQFSRLGALAAVALLVVLIGSLSVGLVLVHRGTTSVAVPAATTATPAVTPTLPSKSTVQVPTPTQTPAGQPVGLATIQMVDANNGWGVTTQNKVVHTSNGGVQWQDVTPAGLSAPVNTDFLSTNLAWVALSVQASSGPGNGSTTLFYTTDGGQHWTQSTLPFVVGQMTFINSQDGWILVGRGVAAGSNAVDIYRTTDGGATWKLVSSASPTADPSDPNALPFGGDKTGMSFVNATTGWVTGSIPTPDFFYLYVTHDGGVTWQHQNLPLPSGVGNTQPSLYPPRFVNAQDGFLLVNISLPNSENQAPFILYVTHDGGASWQSTSFLPASIYDFLDGRQGWATDGTGLWATTDDGQNWIPIQANFAAFQNISSLNFVSPTLGWAISTPSSGAPTLLKTTDGGQSWQALAVSFPG